MAIPFNICLPWDYISKSLYKNSMVTLIQLVLLLFWHMKIIEPSLKILRKPWLLRPNLDSEEVPIIPGTLLMHALCLTSWGSYIIHRELCLYVQATNCCWTKITPQPIIPSFTIAGVNGLYKWDSVLRLMQTIQHLQRWKILGKALYTLSHLLYSVILLWK